MPQRWSMLVPLTMEYRTSQQHQQVVLLLHQSPNFFFWQNKINFSYSHSTNTNIHFWHKHKSWCECLPLTNAVWNINILLHQFTEEIIAPSFYPTSKGFWTKDSLITADQKCGVLGFKYIIYTGCCHDETLRKLKLHLRICFTVNLHNSPKSDPILKVRQRF